MAITTKSEVANRYGLNTRIYDYANYKEGEDNTPLINVTFANISEVNISGDTVWATGGQSHGNIVAFNNPLTGSFKLSTQILTSELIALMAGEDIATATTEVTFRNTALSTMPKYFVIESDTVWQDKFGEVLDEKLTFHKATAKRAFNISYNGDGDPVSVDIEFELGQNDEGKVLTTSRSAHSTEQKPSEPDNGEGQE